jgi:hydrogenase nickel incorporation protein HypA/HybF
MGFLPLDTPSDGVSACKNPMINSEGAGAGPWGGWSGVHELALTQSVVDVITERLGPARVTAVHLEVGRLSGVLPDALRFCFGLVTEGTTLDGARLDISEPAGRGRCRDCGAEFDAADPLVLCDCGSADVEVRGGQDLLVRSVEVG